MVEKDTGKGDEKGKETKEKEAMTEGEMKITENMMKAIRKNGREEENKKESEKRDFKDDTHHDENDHNDDHQSDNDNNETDEYFNYHSLWLSNVRVQCLIMTSSPHSSKQDFIKNLL